MFCAAGIGLTERATDPARSVMVLPVTTDESEEREIVSPVTTPFTVVQSDDAVVEAMSVWPFVKSVPYLPFNVYTWRPVGNVTVSVNVAEPYAAAVAPSTGPATTFPFSSTNVTDVRSLPCPPEPVIWEGYTCCATVIASPLRSITNPANTCF